MAESRNDLLHLDAHERALRLEDDRDGIDDALFGISLAVDDDFVLRDLALAQVEEMLLGKAVVPSAVPSRQGIGIFLECSCEL